MFLFLRALAICHLFRQTLGQHRGAGRGATPFFYRVGAHSLAEPRLKICETKVILFERTG